MKQLVEYDNSIYGCISTYDSLLSKEKVIINLVEEFSDKVAKPINKSLKYIVTTDKNNVKKYKYKQSNWERTKILINEGKVKTLNFIHFDKRMIEAKVQGIDCPEANIYPELINLNIVSNIENPKRASFIEFSINKWMCARDNSQYVSMEFQRLIELVISNMDCVGGFITIDTMAAYESASSHERYVGLEYIFASEKFDKYFRGYSWGNYLSRKHVELLGGIEKIKKEAPVYYVKELSDKGAYLQLTEDIDNVSDEDLRKLKRYFQPILPKAPRMLFPYEAKHKRIVIDDDDEKVYLEKN